MCSFARFRFALIAIHFSVCEGTGYLKPCECRIGLRAKMAESQRRERLTPRDRMGSGDGERAPTDGRAVHSDRGAAELMSSAGGTRFEDVLDAFERPNV